MEAAELTRAEYPSILASLQPAQAVQTMNDRVKRINKINIEIADWLQERRRVEEQYVLGLRKLAQFRVPNAQSELGVFQAPWHRMTEAVERIAQSHHQFADNMEQDVERPLRAFQQRRDVQNIYNISNNLVTMAKDLEDAQEKSDKLTRKGGKASTQKVDAVASRLESTTQQWESQAPFIYETLQALDESRVNLLRDLMTQYQTHESDHAQRVQETTAETLAAMLEINTDAEIQGFVMKTTAGKIPPPTRASTRRSSVIVSQGSMVDRPTTPATPNTGSQPPAAEDGHSEANSLQSEPRPESKLRRLGTMFGGRKRQSVHAGFGQLSPGKSTGPTFGRLGSSHGRGISPRASATNLAESNRLSVLPEMPNTGERPQTRDASTKELLMNGNANGVNANNSLVDASLSAPAASSSPVNGNHAPDLSDVAPPPGPPPSQKPQDTAPSTDAEGFTIRAPMHDPISEAQRDAALDEADQLFKVEIQTQPVADEDPDAKLAALSNVVNTLKLGPATRRTSTIRGRRDVRNTIYAPNIMESQSDGTMPTIPASPPSAFSRPAAVAALASEPSLAGTSDTQSVRSGNSLGGVAYAKHPEMTGPGLNASIIETVSAVFEAGVIKSTTIVGEIAFINNSPQTSDSSKTHETIRINNFNSLERIGPNRIFVQNGSLDQSDQFALDIAHLNRTSTAFSYRVYAAESETPSLGRHAPLMLNTAWKSQGEKLGLLMQYQLNPLSPLTGPVTLHNVVFVATYEGKASGAQTKPSGTHLKDKHLVYWRLGDVTLTDTPQKIVCRIVGAEGAEPIPGHIEARWEYTATGGDTSSVGSGISISKLEMVTNKGKEVATEHDPFADDNPVGAAGQSTPDPTWVDVPSTKKLVSGKYEGR